MAPPFSPAHPFISKKMDRDRYMEPCPYIPWLILVKLKLKVASASSSRSLVAHTNKCGHAISDFWLYLVGTNLVVVFKMSQSLVAYEIQSHMVLLTRSSS
jgi:hypothetical protein